MKLKMKYTYYKVLVSLILFLGFLVNPSQAQWKASFNLEQAFESNPFRFPNPAASAITIFDGGIQKDFESISFSYVGSYSNFNQLADRNNYVHQFSVFNSDSNTELGLSLNQRFNGSEFDEYNYTIWDLFYSHSFNYDDYYFLFNANANYFNYALFSELDNLKFSGGLQINKSFETKTTIITGLNLFFKNYINPYSVIIEDTTQGMVPSAGGLGPGHNSATSNDESSLSQLSFLFRLAQSVTTSTGLALQYQQRIFLSGASRDISQYTMNYADESLIFDDPMGYESSSFGAEITQLLPWKMMLKGAYYQTQKEYSAQGIYLSEEIYDTSVFRSDTYTNSWISLIKQFYIDHGDGIPMNLEFSYQLIDNTSNSYWYNYNNQVFNISLGLNF